MKPSSLLFRLQVRFYEAAMWFRRPSLYQLLLTVLDRIGKVMSAVDNLTAQVAALKDAVATETALLAAQHAELLTALQNAGVNDPAVQAAADAIQAQVAALQKAVADNPDPAAVPAPTA